MLRPRDVAERAPRRAAAGRARHATRAERRRDPAQQRLGVERSSARCAARGRRRRRAAGRAAAPPAAGGRRGSPRAGRRPRTPAGRAWRAAAAARSTSAASGSVSRRLRDTRRDALQRIRGSARRPGRRNSSALARAMRVVVDDVQRIVRVRHVERARCARQAPPTAMKSRPATRSSHASASSRSRDHVGAASCGASPRSRAGAAGRAAASRGGRAGRARAPPARGCRRRDRPSRRRRRRSPRPRRAPRAAPPPPPSSTRMRKPVRCAHRAREVGAVGRVAHRRGGDQVEPLDAA